MSKIKIGLVGCGMIGKIHAEMINQMNDFELVAVADTNPSLCGEIAYRYGCFQFHDYREMLKNADMDLVSVCVPPALHYSVVMDAARAGKHVIVEKPIDVTVEHADRMIEECRKRGVKLCVICQHRFDPVIQQLKKVIDSGRLGKILMGTSRTIWYRDADYYKERNWSSSFANGGGALMNQSIHYIDLLLYLMGDAASVSAACDTLLHKSLEVEDTGIAVIKFRNGAIGTIEGTTAAYPGLFAELNIYGENGSVCVRNDKLDFYKVKDGRIEELEELAAMKSKKEAAVSRAEDLNTASHIKQYTDMFCAIRDGREPAVNGEAGKKAVALINAIYQASARKTWIDLL